jgi:hypothetical protein
MRRLTHLLIVGALTAALVGIQGGQAASGQTGPIGYTVGQQQAMGNGSCHFYAIDMPTGEATQVSTDPVDCADGLTFSPDGTLYAYRSLPSGGVSPAELVTIDLATGAQTRVGDLPAVAVNAGGMTFDLAGNLWLYALSSELPCTDSGFTSCLWQVDPSDAGATFVGAAPEEDAVFGLAGNCAGEVLALSARPAAGVSDTRLNRVDTATAELTTIVDLPETFFPQGLDYDADDGLWALSGVEARGGIGLMETELIDPATGDVTRTTISVGGDEFFGFLSGLAISPISCPEPPPTPEPVVVVPTFTG